MSEALQLAELLTNLKFTVKGRENAEAMETAAAELRRLHKFQVAYNEWHEKTQWVQDTAAPNELGMHRLDVMRQRIERLHAENDALREANEAFGKRQEWWNEKMVALEERNAELVEALQLVLNNNECLLGERVARAAMAKAQGEMK